MDKDQIVQFCPEFWQVSPSFIQAELKLDDPGLPHNTSIRFYQFLAAVESKFKVQIDNLDTLFTFGDVFKYLDAFT